MSGTERFADALWQKLKHNSVPILSALVVGLLAHGFAFTNKLVNADEVVTLFGKGSTIPSGRWGLALTSFLFPNVSMPWIYGILSILMLAAATALVMKIFRVRSPLLQALLAAVIVSFPAQTATFSYMFTSASYALAFLLAVGAVYAAEKNTAASQALSAALMVLSLGIYQAYVSLLAGFFVLRMIQRLLENEGNAREIFFYGLKRLALLLAALLVYYAIAVVLVKHSGQQFVEYGVEQKNSIFFRAALAYNAFLRTFTRGYFGFIDSPLSVALHGLCAIIVGVIVVCRLVSMRDWGKRGLLLLCLALFPLSINCIYLIASVGIIYSPVLYGFVSVYVLAAVVVDSVDGRRGLAARDAVLVSLAAVTLCNVYFANKAYLKMHVDYENAYALYTGIAAQVRQTEGFDENSKLCLIGKAEQGLYHAEELDLGELIGPSRDLVNIYTREYLLIHYVGFDVPMATAEESAAMRKDPRVEEMPSYPYYGSVQKIDDYIVVKLG